MRGKSSSYLLLLIAFGAGVPVTVYGVMLILDAWASEGWPTTSGRVIESRVTETRSRNSGTDYRAEITFEYEVDGAAHRSDRWTFNNPKFNSSSEARAVASRYPVDAEVEVYFDPDDPSTAVLQPGAGFFTYIYFIFGLSLIGLGVFVAFRVTRLTSK